MPGNILELVFGSANNTRPLGVALVSNVSAHPQVRVQMLREHGPQKHHGFSRGCSCPTSSICRTLQAQEFKVKLGITTAKGTLGSSFKMISSCKQKGILAWWINGKEETWNRSCHQLRNAALVLAKESVELMRPSEPCPKVQSFFLYMGVSKNRGTPKSSILIGFSIINHPFWGTGYPYFWKHPYIHYSWCGNLMAPASNVLLYSLEQPLGFTNLVGLRHLLSPWWILELNGIIENRYPGNRNSLHKFLPVSPQPWGTHSFTGLRRLVQKQLEDGILDQSMMDGLWLLQPCQSAWTKAWSFESNAKEGVYIVRHLNNPVVAYFFFSKITFSST